MASGRAHDRATLIVSAPLGLCMATLGGIDAGLVAAAACSFGGLWLSPDLDTHSNALRRWGALRGLWWPYCRVIPHRSLCPMAPDRHRPAAAAAAGLVGSAVRTHWLAQERGIATTGQLAGTTAPSGHRPRDRPGGQRLAASDPGWRSMARGMGTAAPAMRRWARIEPSLHGFRAA